MQNLTGARILLTGGAGFIGSHIVDELIKEDVEKIIIYDNFSRGSYDNIKHLLKDKRVEVFSEGGDILYYDLLDKALDGIDYVFHLAALWLLHCHDYPRSAFKVNIEGSFNVLELSVKHKIKKLILSSSASVYGDALEIPMTENHPFNNKTFYGATKIALEQMAKSMYYRYGLNFIGLRYMNVYGPRQDDKGAYVSVIMKWFNSILKGQPITIYGDGKQSYDFIYVKDVAKANILALKSDKTNEFYNISTGIATSLNELSKVMLDITDKKLPVVYKKDISPFVKNRIGSTQKAFDELSFKAEYSLHDGIKELYKWLKESKG